MNDDKKKKFGKLLEKKWVGNTVALCIAVLFYLGVSHLNYLFRGIGTFFGYISPVIYGIVIAYIINPLANWFEYKVFKKIKKEHRRHNTAVAFALILVFAVIGLLIGSLVPSLINSVATITNNMEIYINDVEQFSKNYSAVFDSFGIDLVKMVNSWEDMLSKVIFSVTQNTEMIVAASQNVGKSATNFLLGLVLAIYFLLAKRSLLDGINRLRGLLIKEKTLKDHDIFFERCHKILGSFIGFDIIDGIIVGGINAVLMAIFGMPSIALISVVVGVTNLLPTFGPIIGAVVGAFILVLTSPMHALIFIIFTIVIQIFDGYILKPKMFGESLGVPAVWILVSIVVGGKIFGIIGILLAIPFAAIISFVYEEKLIPFLQSRMDKDED